MYIEYLNLPEFVDDTWGETRGHNRGRLEIYCDNLEDDNYEQDDGYGTQTLLYSSPLKSFDSFRNSDPLKISNFKIRSNFLRDQGVLVVFSIKHGFYNSPNEERRFRFLYNCVLPRFFRTKNNKKKEFYNSPNEKRRFRVFTTPLTLPLTSLTSGFRIRYSADMRPESRLECRISKCRISIHQLTSVPRSNPIGTEVNRS
jgi:hypothetical protein